MFLYYDWRIWACTADCSGALWFISGFSGGRVVFCRSFVVLCPYYCWYCIACPFSIDDFWLTFWHIQTRIDNYVLADFYLKFPDSSTPCTKNKNKPWLYMLVNKLKYDINLFINICALLCQIKLNRLYFVSISQLRDP